MHQTVFQDMILFGAIGITLGAGSPVFFMVLVKRYLNDGQPAVLSVYRMMVGIPILGIMAWLYGESIGVLVPVPSINAVSYLGTVPSVFDFVWSNLSEPGAFGSFLKEISSGWPQKNGTRKFLVGSGGRAIFMRAK